VAALLAVAFYHQPSESLADWTLSATYTATASRRAIQYVAALYRHDLAAVAAADPVMRVLAGEDIYAM
jgi:hypothetical protein